DQGRNGDGIADSIKTMRVMARTELSVLHRLGWVVSKKGTEGESMRNRESCKISRADIYNAVKNSNVLGKKNTCGDNCPIGKEINMELEKLFNETDEIVVHALEKKSLKSFVDQFH